MSPDSSNDHSLADDEILVYVGTDYAVNEDADAFEQQARGKSAAERGLAKVKISDEELDRLRGQIQRIASKLEPADDSSSANRLAVDEVTLHVGLSASGQFFFIANAGVEAAVDVTRRRRGK